MTDAPSPLRRRLPNALALALVLALGTAPASIARADAPSSEAAAEARRVQAKLKFNDGVAAFGAHRYADAVAAFLQADAIEPSAALSFNIARAFEHLDNPSSALRWYRDYLRREPQAVNAVEVQARVAALAAALAEHGVQQLTVISTPAGASVVIDRQVAGTAPVTTELAPGTHHLRLELTGYSALETDVVLDARRAQDFPFQLEAIAIESPKREAPPRSSASPARPAHLERPFGPAPWIVLGAGGASVLGALGFELSRRSAESAAEHATQRDYPAHFDAMQSRQTTARVLAGVGGA
ncbi:MAG TPA: PEGA domain-containing protein, partial [Polyangiaceae bacterium]|nr:PEGA domain-containing protein [Polyangiaceae bacterium]